MAVARSLTVELFPPVLQRSGLPAALKWLANWAYDEVQAQGPHHRRSSRRLHAKGRPHAAVRVGQGASVQRRQIRADGSSHAGAGARCRRSAVHHGGGSGRGLRRRQARRSIEVRAGGLGPVPHPRAADAARRPPRHRQRARRGDAGPPGRAARGGAQRRRRRERDERTAVRSGGGSRRRARVPGCAPDSHRRRSPAGEARAARDAPSTAAALGRRRCLERLRGDRPRAQAEARCHPHGRVDAAHGRCRRDRTHPQRAPRCPDSGSVDDGPERDRGGDRACGGGGVLRQGDRHAAIDRSPDGVARITRRWRSRGT